MQKQAVSYRMSFALTSLVVSELLLAAMLFAGWFVLVPMVPGLKLERPEWIWIFAAGPVFSLLFALIFWWKKRALEQFASAAMLGYLAPQRSTGKPVLKFLLFRWAVFFLTIALINPKLGTKMAEAKQEGIDMMIAIDVSRSMLAEDIKPNRLERAKRGISQMIDKLYGDRVGIIVFAGDAYVQLPITNDYSAARMFLKTINTEIVPVQGTSIGAAIDLALESFDFENATQKAIVIISDGEDHEAEAISAAQRAGEKEVVIYTRGMGTVQGGPIPLYSGRQQSGYHKNKDGNTVVTRLNEEILQDIAATAGGTFVRASTAKMGLDMILGEINQMNKTEFGTVTYTEYEDRFQPFIVVALVLLLWSFIIGERKSVWREKFKLFEA